MEWCLKVVHTIYFWILCDQKELHFVGDELLKYTVWFHHAKSSRQKQLHAQIVTQFWKTIIDVVLQFT